MLEQTSDVIHKPNLKNKKRAHRLCPVSLTVGEFFHLVSSHLEQLDPQTAVRAGSSQHTITF